MEIRQNQVIGFILNDVETIREGLKKYQELLQKDLVNSSSEMDVLFAYTENGQLKPLQSYHGEEKYLKELEKISMGSYTGRELTFESVSSEAIFFSHALKFDELLEDVVGTAKEIVNYSRRHNDTWYMWADEMGVFGLDALYILAKKYPEYTYFIGGFIIPYWDNEHADYAFRYLLQLYEDNGFTDDLMKAFCYCDSDEGRLTMLGIPYNYDVDNPFDLGAYFKENPNKYQLFKNMLKERFKEQKYLQYSDSDYTDRPVQKIYGVIMYSSEEDTDAYGDGYEDSLEKYFIVDSYDNESFELQQEIENELGYPLTEKQKDDEDEEVYENEIWEDFFLNGFENGEEIWNYIMCGDKKEVLNTIEPTDIKTFSKEKKLLFYKEKILWFVGGYETFDECFHNVFQGFIDEYYEEPEGNFRISINGSEISGREIVVRALDVFYKLSGEKCFSADLFNLIISYKIMNVDEFVDRYDLNKKPSISDLSYLISFPMGHIKFSTKNDFDRIYKYIERDREKAKILFEGKTSQQIEKGYEDKILLRDDISKDRDAQVELIKNGLTFKVENIAVVMYILEREYKNNRTDELTKLLIDYIEKNWLNIMFANLQEGSSLNQNDVDKIKSYIVGRQAPPKELFMKAITQGREALTEEEIKLLNPNSPVVPLEELVDLLKGKLKKSNNKKTIKYKIFNGMSDYSLTPLIPAFYFGGFRLNLNSSIQFQRALKLFSGIAPLKVMTVLYGACYAQIENYTTYDFRMDMKKLSKDEVAILSVEIKEAEGKSLEQYAVMYMEAEDGPSYSMIKSYSKSEFEKALSYLKNHERERFLEEVAKKSPDSVDYLDEFIKELKNFSKSNIKRELYSDKKTQKKLEDETCELLKDYLNGSDNISEILKNLESVSTTDNFVKLLWKVDEVHRDRILTLFIQMGPEGLNEGISNLVLREDSVDMMDYLEKMRDLGSSTESLVKFGIKWEVKEALFIANSKEDIYPLIKNMSITEREKALKLLKNKKNMKEFILKMATDRSSRIRKIAQDILEKM